MNQDLPAIRRWHAAMAAKGPTLLDFSGAQACYVHDVRILLRHIDQLERERAELSAAATDALLPIVGSPCEPWYVKGWNDALRAAAPRLRTAFNRMRLLGRDSHDQERSALDAIDGMRRRSTDIPPSH